MRSIPLVDPSRAFDERRERPPLPADDPILDLRDLPDRGDISALRVLPCPDRALTLLCAGDRDMYGCFPWSPFEPFDVFFDDEETVAASTGGGEICAVCAVDMVGLAMARPEAASALSPVGLRVVDRRHGRLPPLSTVRVFSRASEDTVFVVPEAEAGRVAEWCVCVLPFVVVEVEEFVCGNLTSVGLSTRGFIVTWPLSLVASAGAVAARAWLGVVEISGKLPLMDLFEPCFLT